MGMHCCCNCLLSSREHKKHTARHRPQILVVFYRTKKKHQTRTRRATQQVAAAAGAVAAQKTIHRLHPMAPPHKYPANQTLNTLAAPSSYVYHASGSPIRHEIRSHLIQHRLHVLQRQWQQCIHIIVVVHVRHARRRKRRLDIRGRHTRGRPPPRPSS